MNALAFTGTSAVQFYRETRHTMQMLWREIIRRFAGHVLIATTIFLIFGGAAICLSILVHYLEPAAYVSRFTIEVLTFVEGATLVADSLLYSGYLVVATWTPFKELKK